MLFIRNGRFWNTDYPVLILKKFESSLPTKSWTESAILFSQLNFSVQLNRTLPATMYYLFISKSSRKLWMLQDFPEIYNYYVLAFCRNFLELLQISSLQNWRDIFSSGDPSQPLLIPMITDRIRLHSVLFRPSFIAWNMSVYVWHSEKDQKIMLTHPKKVPAEVIRRAKKFLQAEYSPPSSPITSQHQ